MWLFHPIGFFSVVRKPGEKRLSIRARAASDLDRLRDGYLPALSATEQWPNADYPYRAFAAPLAWAEAAAKMAAEIDYSNFKSEVSAARGPSRASAYHEVWAALMNLQAADDRDAARREALFNSDRTKAKATGKRKAVRR